MEKLNFSCLRISAETMFIILFLTAFKADILLLSSASFLS